MRRRLHFAIAVVGVLMLGACGSDAKQAEPTTTVPTTTPAADTTLAPSTTAASVDTSTEATPPADTTPIEVGYIGDLTGPDVPSEVPFLNGINAAIGSVNADGGINGRPIKLMIEDSRFDVPTAVAAYQKLIADDKMVALMGLNSSSIIAALTPEIDKVGIPLVGPQATTEVGLASENVYNLQASLGDQGVALVNYLAKQYPNPKVGTAVINVASGAEWEKVIGDAVPKVGGTTVGFEKLEPGAVEATSQVGALMSAGAQVVTLHSNIPLAVVLLKEMQVQGFDVPLYTSYGAAGEALWKGAGDFDTSKIFGVNGFAMYYADVEGQAQMAKDIKAAGFGDKDLGSTTAFTQGYVAGRILAEALLKAGSNITRESLNTALRNPDGFSTLGFAAPVNWSGAAPHAGVKEVRVFGWDKATEHIVPVSDSIAAP